MSRTVQRETPSFYNFICVYNPVSDLKPGLFLKKMQKFTHMGRENKKTVRYNIGENRVKVYFYAPEAMTGRDKKSGR